MGSVFKKAYTKPMPPGAEIIARKGQRLARWRDSQGKIQTAPLTTGKDGSERPSLESRTYFARYRDGDGIVVERSTECRDEGAARSVLAALERGPIGSGPASSPRKSWRSPTGCPTRSPVTPPIMSRP